MGILDRPCVVRKTFPDRGRRHHRKVAMSPSGRPTFSAPGPSRAGKGLLARSRRVARDPGRGSGARAPSAKVRSRRVHDRDAWRWRGRRSEDLEDVLPALLASGTAFDVDPGQPAHKGGSLKRRALECGRSHPGRRGEESDGVNSSAASVMIFTLSPSA